ncbi:oxidoreductase [Mycobacterium sp. Marseille-P9652]|uniref:oxidoreductase n=1 Tax=Mycobacterium sp. Marseille-P9652 TaxID=2654950 RepID=UPI0012E7FC04|nr:oxidoreductase [Mycobacterium sp. Marseille-P9652]
MFRLLSLGGYVAFDAPRAVTALGAGLLVALAATHAYLLTSLQAPPAFFVAYAVAAIAGCLAAAAALGYGRNRLAPQAGWLLGSLLSMLFLALDLGTRVASVPGLTTATGRWDFAPATFALAFAGAFLALHASVLLGINVAHPRRQHWND